ncbi:MAG: assimilatory sulfite reductase (NADPH) flavoprotein subunit [Gammaproteobacteria bacterium]|nr:assimilatory sulfite reductase (NADPH) flavoprotein subunit [Gammaproteobacteria bacterium]
MAISTKTVTGMLPHTSLNELHASISSFSNEQLQWASGYLAGLATAQTRVPAAAENQVAVHSAAQNAVTITVLYGSQTGNGRNVATRIAASLKQGGAVVQMISMLDYRVQKLKNEQILLLVISTHGEGEPPDDAEDFVEFLLGKRAPRLPDLQFSVLALGDSSYEYFCETGRQVDERLAELGATRLSARVECDVDFSKDAESWSQNMVSAVRDKLTDVAPGAVITPLHPVPAVQAAAKEHPVTAEIIGVQKITGRNSDKDVRHIEIATSGGGLSYQAGDALGVIVKNSSELVDSIIAELGCDPDDQVQIADQVMSIHDALIEKLEITQLSRKFVESYAQTACPPRLAGLLDPVRRKDLSAFIEKHQVIDLLKQYPPGNALSAQEFVDVLRPLEPRLYSIASSPSVFADEVHLTVAVVQYKANGEARYGAASAYLGRQLQAGDKVEVYVEPNPRFRLPADAQTPVIMIGAGTGVAPFRAFLDERDAVDAGGPNWLFVGDRTFADDFLYQLEWQRHLKSGRLTRLDVAFSRDQADKIYVQHRLKEHGEEVYRWLQNGACIYVCGDAKRMAPDVHQALLDVIGEQGGKDRQAAAEYLKSLRRNGRYLRDVY